MHRIATVAEMHRRQQALRKLKRSICRSSARRQYATNRLRTGKRSTNNLDRSTIQQPCARSSNGMNVQDHNRPFGMLRFRSGSNGACRQSQQWHHGKRQMSNTTAGANVKKGREKASATSSSVAAAASAKGVKEPTFEQLKLVAITQGIPFIGFGIMDNAILIIAGDAIDTSLGVILGISTMCAAAIGNIISDVVGILFGTVIEDFCATVLKLPVPSLTEAQRQLRSVRWAGQVGCGTGIVIGCIIGMFPLLFLDPQKTERKKRDAHLEGLFRDVVIEAKTLVGAESTCLYLRVQPPPKPRKKEDSSSSSLSSKSWLYWWHSSIYGSASSNIDKRSLHPTAKGTHLFAMYYILPTEIPASSSDADGGESQQQQQPSALSQLLDRASSSMTIPGASSMSSQSSSRMIPLGRGIVSRAALTGQPWNIYDVHSEPDFISDPSDEQLSSVIPSQVKNMVVVPVLDQQGRTIAVIQAMNKISGGQDGNKNSKLNRNKKYSETETLQHGFTDHDVQILMTLASHISVSLQSIYVDATEQDEEELRLKNTIRILKEHGISGIQRAAEGDGGGGTSNVTAAARRADLFPE